MLFRSVTSNRKDSGKTPASRTRKPRSKAAAEPDLARSASAGPSSAGPSRSRRGRAAAITEDDEAEKLSLYQDDPKEDDPDFDDIEEISSPPPPARRVGTRAVPSTSQSLTLDLDSDIEEVDGPPVPKVTLIRREDLPLNVADDDDVEMRCKNELEQLREEVRRALIMTRLGALTCTHLRCGGGGPST